MTNALETAPMEQSPARAPAVPFRSRFWVIASLYSAVIIAAILVLNMPGATDYVGGDNDDTMRLIEVRDLLGGQSWFDMVQHRLGLEGGTLMHWSRFIDLPIATLIAIFRLFLGPIQAEAAALTVWPLLLAAVLLFIMGFAGRRLGGIPVMHAALGLTGILLITSNRFLPGAIDHHNVQLILVALITAMIADPGQRPSNFAVAGIASALALAIGVETTPFIAVASILVAVLWAWHGASFAPAARSYGLSLALAITAAFLITVPPRLYSAVTCDSLSLGFYALASIGGGALVVSALVANRLSFRGRLGVLAIDGALVLAATLVVAPQCLRNPLAQLDPMLISLWLSGVTEAQPFTEQLRREPGSVGAFYIVGVLALAVCAFRFHRRDRAELHAILFVLLLICWGVALVQIRGAVFANLLAILPLALIIMDLRRISNADPENLGAGFVYLVMALIAVPPVWTIGGVLATEGTKGFIERAKSLSATPSLGCKSPAALAQLAALPTDVVAAPSELGVHILRYTTHRTLSGPYHRDQGGMLTELHIGLSAPSESEAFLRGAGVGILAFCPGDLQSRALMELKPDGLYAQLRDGKVPAYLGPLPVPATSDLRLYRVLPATASAE